MNWLVGYLFYFFFLLFGFSVFLCCFVLRCAFYFISNDLNVQPEWEIHLAGEFFEFNDLAAGLMSSLSTTLILLCGKLFFYVILNFFLFHPLIHFFFLFLLIQFTFDFFLAFIHSTNCQKHFSFVAFSFICFVFFSFYTNIYRKELYEKVF